MYLIENLGKYKTLQLTLQKVILLSFGSNYQTIRIQAKHPLPMHILICGMAKH